MPRAARLQLRADYYHVLNRGQLRQLLFAEPSDYQLFVKLLGKAPNAADVPCLAYCVMPNHWHLIVRPTSRPALSAYLHWVSGTHALRWNRSRGRTGLGHVYQGRFKAFPILYERHLLTAIRYVEANPVRAGLVDHAADWSWSSNANHRPAEGPRLLAWPMPKPPNWQAMLDGPVEESELQQLRAASRTQRALDSPIPRRGRPKKGNSPRFTRPLE
jgi:putative transposase